MKRSVNENRINFDREREREFLRERADVASYFSGRDAVVAFPGEQIAGARQQRHRDESEERKKKDALVIQCKTGDSPGLPVAFASDETHTETFFF